MPKGGARPGAGRKGGGTRQYCLFLPKPVIDRLSVAGDGVTSDINAICVKAITAYLNRKPRKPCVKCGKRTTHRIEEEFVCKTCSMPEPEQGTLHRILKEIVEERRGKSHS